MIYIHWITLMFLMKTDFLFQLMIKMKTEGQRLSRKYVAIQLLIRSDSYIIV